MTEPAAGKSPDSLPEHPTFNDEWLRTALLAARMGTWEWRITSGEVFWSDNVESMFGLPTGTFDKKYDTYLKLVHPGDLQAVQTTVQRALDGFVDNYEVAHRIIWPDGSTHWLEGRGRVIRDGNSKPIRMLGTVVDITARIQAEEKARMYANIVEYLQMGLYVYHLDDVTDDRSLRLVAANPAAEKLLGIPNVHALGMTIDQIFPKLRERGIPAVIADVARNGTTGEYLDFTYSDERVIEAVWSFNIFPAPNGCAGVCFQNVTERKRLEARLIQSHKLEGIGRLAGGVAHDFNNLLTGILGYVEIAKMSLPPDSPVHQPLQEVFGAGERAKNLTKQLLAFAQRQIVEPRVLNVNRLIADFHKLLARILRDDIDIALSFCSENPCVKIDPGQFEQVVMNLAINARDAMPSGGRLTIQTRVVKLDGRCLRDLPLGEYVLITIHDTGTGIDPEVLPHIFEPFFTTKAAGIGTGLGLATVHGIIQQNGGHIDVESAENKGSTFRIHLPRVSPESITDAVRMSPPEEVPNGTETVLLVEDEEIVRNVAARTLRAYGYTVLEAMDADTAMTIANQYGGNIDMLLTDVVMPRVSGAQLARRIQEQWPRVKVLYSSGYTDNTIVHHGVLDDGIAFLPKPYTPTALARKVREILNAR
jgi:two-component system, cell cycle sensor histidine kinase and response regulator CckA